MEHQASSVFWLSPQQTAIWSGQTAGSPWNVVAQVQLDGPVHSEQLRRALGSVVRRHEILRTVCLNQSGMKIPFQKILDESEPAWTVADLSGCSAEQQHELLDRIFRAEIERRFDFERGPLVQAQYICLADSRAVLFVTMPALLSDAPALNLFIDKIASAYAGSLPATEDEPFRYVQFAQWQTDTLASDDETASKAKEYWNGEAENSETVLVLPEQKLSGGEFRPAVVSAAIAARAMAESNALCDGRASDDIVLLAGWQTLLWRLTGQRRFTVRLFVEGREYDELSEALGAIGKFLPVSVRFEADFSFRDVVERLKRTASDAMQWQEYFQPGAGADNGSAVAYEYARPGETRAADGVTFTLAKRWACYERFAVKLSVLRSEEQFSLDLSYDESRLGAEAATRLLGYLKTLLTDALARPDVPVRQLALLTQVERRQLLNDWNRTEEDYPRSACFHHLFESQVERTPDRPAVRAGDQHLTYRQLNDRSNRLAHYLRQIGVAPDRGVALCLDRNVDMIVGLLAILKAGGAYIPLNADNPKPRLAHQMTGAVALITETKLAANLPEFPGTRILMDRDGRQWSEEPATNPAATAAADHLAYVIFTSGSTGTPKGVAVRHRNLVNYATCIAHKLGADSSSGGLHFATVSTLSADLGNTCIFPALLSGGCVHVIAQDLAADAAKLGEYQHQHPIDVLKVVPSHLQALLETAEGASVLPRKVLITGGEALMPALVRRIRELSTGCAILNHYGPTETTIGSLTFPVMPEDPLTGPIPIGRPIANTKVYILDASREPVPIGVTGELYIAGDGVTAGYLNQPELTDERFIDNPYNAGKMYRTGDLARYRADGNVEFLGREDNQVKVRGFRIELGELEAALATHPAVRQTAVIARRDARDEARLIAYVVPHRDRSVTSAVLREFLKEQLPDYMIPTVVLLSKLPLTANGKVDRHNLPEPSETEERPYLAPRNATEQAIAGIWAEVFRRDQVGVRDSFFEMGGHSLMATQVISRVREQFRVTVEMRVLFESPTVEGIAEAVLAAQTAPAQRNEAEIVPVPRDRYRRK